MSRRDAFWRGVPSHGSGRIVWPDDQNERAELIRQLLGCRLMASLDAEIGDAYRLASGGRPEAAGAPAKAEEDLTGRLAGITPAQRQAVHVLVKRVCARTLYWSLIKLALPSARVEVRGRPLDPSGRPLPGVVIGEQQLNDVYIDWINEFSDQLGETV